MSDRPLIAGVELGGTKTICILATGPDDVRDEVRVPTTTPDETLSAVRAVLERWQGEHGFAAIGVASFGPLELDPASAEHGRIVSTPKPGWSGADALGLATGLGVPAALDTDVNGAALAEGRWGTARGLDSWTYVTVGTGIGVGSIVEGRPVRGLGHSEAGHLRVPRLAGDAWPGACPYHSDCAEGLASGPAIKARTGRPAETLSPEDPAWDGVVHALAGLFHNLTLTALPQRILLGGGVGAGQAHLLPRIREALKASLGGYGATGRIDFERFLQPPGLGDLAGPLGAIALGLSALEAKSDSGAA
ncbi:MAG: ROK family protein [Brevundimonas sp.]